MFNLLLSITQRSLVIKMENRICYRQKIIWHLLKSVIWVIMKSVKLLSNLTQFVLVLFLPYFATVLWH